MPWTPWSHVFAAGVSVHVDFIVAVVARAHRLAARVRALPAPPSTTAVHAIDAFDNRYAAAPVDVASTGTWVTVPVMSCAVGLSTGYVCVPAVEARMYRTLALSNRSPLVLLPGPVDVSEGDEFLLTSTLPPMSK